MMCCLYQVCYRVANASSFAQVGTLLRPGAVISSEKGWVNDRNKTFSLSLQQEDFWFRGFGLNRGAGQDQVRAVVESIAARKARRAVTVKDCSTEPTSESVTGPRGAVSSVLQSSNLGPDDQNGQESAAAAITFTAPGTYKAPPYKSILHRACLAK